MFALKTKQTTQDQTKQKQDPALVVLLTLIIFNTTPGILKASRLEESFVLYKYVHRKVRVGLCVKARPDQTRPEKTRRDKTRRDETRQDR